MQGWIKLHRKLRDNPIWKKEKFTKGQAWVDILLMTNHADYKMLVGNEMILCKRGQVIRSIKTYEKLWKWSPNKVRNFFRLLSNEKMIEIKTSTKVTTLNVLDYDVYQDQEQTKEKRKKNEKKTKKKKKKNERYTNKKERKNVCKNEENEKKEERKEKEKIFLPPSSSEILQIFLKATEKKKLANSEALKFGEWAKENNRLDNKKFCENLEENIKSWMVRAEKYKSEKQKPSEGGNKSWLNVGAHKESFEEQEQARVDFFKNETEQEKEIRHLIKEAERKMALSRNTDYTKTLSPKNLKALRAEIKVLGNRIKDSRNKEEEK